MKIQTISYRYEERRSRQYNSAGVAVEVTVTLDEGEDAERVRLGLRKRCKQIVRADIEDAVQEVVQAEQDHLNQKITAMERSRPT